MGMLFRTTGSFAIIGFTGVTPTRRKTDCPSTESERRRRTTRSGTGWPRCGGNALHFFSAMLLMAPYNSLVYFTGVTTFFAYWLHPRKNVLYQAYDGQRMSAFMEIGPQPQYQVHRKLILDVVVDQRVAVLQQLASEDQTLLARLNALLEFDCLLHVVDRVDLLRVLADEFIPVERFHPHGLLIALPHHAAQIRWLWRCLQPLATSS
ncbi:hypothetical protein PR001_g10565 [Phytophthora rubi]|uniref:Uncharacterized protein n=1 Tax=Phytophthora rubi TaxID=129364 RepID=A0A6A3MX77_9STRA|nr:hypothetical protein PR001_g10565 [Phytophthora rubi]